MIDFTNGYADYAYKVIEAERLERAERGRWRHELRLLSRRARRKATRSGRTVVISQPEHLRGLQKVWF